MLIVLDLLEYDQFFFFGEENISGEIRKKKKKKKGFDVSVLYRILGLSFVKSIIFCVFYIIKC